MKKCEKDLEALDAVGHLDNWNVFVFVERRAKRPFKGQVSVAVLPDFCSFSLSTLIQLWCLMSFGSDFGLARWFCPLDVPQNYGKSKEYPKINAPKIPFF